MIEEPILNLWNKGHYQEIVNGINIEKALGTEEFFFYIDAHIQLNELEKASTLISNYLESNNNEEINLAKKILLVKIMVRYDKFEETEAFLSELPSPHSELSKWFISILVQLKALNYYVKNYFHKSLETLELLEKNQPLIKKLYSKYNNSYYYSLRGLLNWRIGNYSEAMDDTKLSMEINNQFENRYKLANDYLVIAQINMDLSDLLTSIQYLNKAEIIFNDFNNSYGQALVLLSRGEVNFYQGKLQEALDLFEQGKRRFHGDEYQLVDIYFQIGKIHQKLKNYNLAQSNYEKTLELSMKLDIDYFKYLALLTMMDLQVSEKKFSDAEYYYKLVPAKASDSIIDKFSLMMNALKLEIDQDLANSLELWSFISNSANLPFNMQLYCLENTLRIAIKIWSDKKEISLLEKVQSIFDQWEEIATKNSLMSSLYTINVLKAKFYLGMLNTESSKKYLSEAIKLAGMLGIEDKFTDLKSETNKIEQIEKIGVVDTEVTLQYKIDFDNMIDYINYVKINLLNIKK